ncbi:uncharacterized protein LOC115624948 [Scaptodrosophila lebanonensis]|uniref:Uncharacterized protein LOC115624948 n=1 Tax=Drosophila lebanonensis TaxID=7225 RepID=A0A6J2TI09_DROLE|nr:uncharacterized protein LOC115624948 [Scaptodrosophila lebanonensis]
MGDRYSQLYYYKKRRQKFACTVYILALVFLILAFIQWFLFNYISDVATIFIDYYWIGIIFFVIALILIIVFVFFENLRFLTPCNWILAFLIIECLILGLAPLIPRQYLLHFVVSFIIWAAVLWLFILIGSFLPHDLTLDVVVLFVIAVVAIVGAVYFLMLYIVINVPYSFFVHRGFIVLSIVLFVMYHAQIINGKRFAEMRVQDYLLGAIILFLDFLLMFLYSFYLAPKWSDKCDTERNATSWMVIKEKDDHRTYPTRDPKAFEYMMTTLDYD